MASIQDYTQSTAFSNAISNLRVYLRFLQGHGYTIKSFGVQNILDDVLDEMVNDIDSVRHHSVLNTRNVIHNSLIKAKAMTSALSVKNEATTSLVKGMLHSSPLGQPNHLYRFFRLDP